MADLLAATALTQIETLLQREVALAVQKRLTVATVAALRALDSASRTHLEMARVTASTAVYYFDRYSTATDDGSTAIKPTDRTTIQPGRWLATISTSSYGYCRQVVLYEGESTPEEIIGRLGNKPVVVICWQGSSHTPASQIAGSLYDWRPRFDLWVVSSSLRGEHQASTGSQIASEATADPGANRILGDLKTALAGSTLADQPGVKWVEILDEDRVLSSLADRLMLYRLGVEVRCTLHIPDAAGDLVALSEMWVQRQVADVHDETEMDEENCVRTGLYVPMGAGLTQTVAAGSARISNATVAVAGAAVTFAANKDTYRDLSAGGAWTFTAVDRGFPEPSQATGVLRVGVTTTDASGVTGDRFLCGTLEDFGAMDRVIP